jgi:hypothetical protein
MDFYQDALETYIDLFTTYPQTIIILAIIGLLLYIPIKLIFFSAFAQDMNFLIPRKLLRIILSIALAGVLSFLFMLFFLWFFTKNLGTCNMACGFIGATLLPPFLICFVIFFAIVYYLTGKKFKS